MDHYAQVLKSAVTAGSSLEAGLVQVRNLGATPVEAIKAIREVKGVSLGEAKQIFSLSPAWSRESEAADALHEQLAALTEKGRKA